MTKIISLSDDAYDYLKNLKENNESFSKVVRRLIPKKDKRQLLNFVGAIKDESFFNSMNEVKKEREKLKFKTPKFED
jgi:predicted CopG family antitoxin